MSGHTIWVWLAEPEGKTPYTVGFSTRSGEWLPLVSPRRELMEELETVAKLHEKRSGDPVRLVRFDEVPA